MAARRYPMQMLNTADRAAFVAALDGIFEHSPWVAEAVWPQRPFASRAYLHRAMCSVVASASRETQLALIRAHPDLAGRAAQQGRLGAESSQEQTVAGLNRLTPEEQAEFARLNSAYWERFGFPFVICARENKKAAILAGFRARLPNTREQEIATALSEIDRIAWFRLCDTVEEQQV